MDQRLTRIDSLPLNESHVAVDMRLVFAHSWLDYIDVSRVEPSEKSWRRRTISSPPRKNIASKNFYQRSYGEYHTYALARTYYRYSNTPATQTKRAYPKSSQRPANMAPSFDQLDPETEYDDGEDEIDFSGRPIGAFDALPRY